VLAVVVMVRVNAVICICLCDDVVAGGGGGGDGSVCMRVCVCVWGGGGVHVFGRMDVPTMATAPSHFSSFVFTQPPHVPSSLNRTCRIHILARLPIGAPPLRPAYVGGGAVTGARDVDGNDNADDEGMGAFASLDSAEPLESAADKRRREEEEERQREEEAAEAQRKREEEAAIKVQAAARGLAARKRVLAVMSRDSTSVPWGFRLRFAFSDHPIIE
jgi:hypothetical protein